MEFNLEVRAQSGKVYTNASDLLPAIQEGLKAYDYIVDENNYKQAKSDRTTLNNLVKIVSDKRKQVENDVFAQWLQDKKDIMAVEKTIKAASDKLGNGINDIDNAEKELKKNQIKELWLNMTNNKYPFELVFEERYLNKSVKPKEIEESLNNKFLKAEEQLSFIEASLPDDELQAEQVIQLFCKTLDLSKATERINEIKEAKAKLQEKVNAQIEQSKQAQMERENVAPVQSQLEAHESQSQSQARRYCVFRFEGSMEELQAFNPILNQFIKEHDVKVNILEKGEC
ncbi:MAG: DUF1351 domain-containing protein [Holdemanella biformis]|uniref:DUF1351 domain-containing protein n=1 Tax=Holdemanella biformis TaxID=1735 RepID=UPI002432B48E|nr:DUF1351 domain-containing protein [Holdemanella biformis]MBS6455011.1 DUF1351 domain-containing protein [Holdemanella biformis]